MIGMNKRIGFITERMLLGFGVDLVIHNVAAGLASRGHNVNVYASVSDGTYANRGYSLRMIPTTAFPFAPAYELSALRHLNYLNREKIDIWFIETFPYFPMLAFLKKPAIGVFYGISSPLGFPPARKLNFLYMDFALKHFYLKFSKKIIAISNYLKDILPGTVQKNTEVIYNGSDHYPDHMDPGEAAKFRRSIGIGENDILLLYVGRLNPARQPYKGTAELVSIYRKIKAGTNLIKLMMVGYGDAEDRDCFESQGIISYIKVPAAMMPLIYSACDIYVTATRWEGFNLPLSEAQYFGKPVIAYDCTAHPEIVRDGVNGFLVRAPSEFIDRVLTLANDPGLRHRMGQNAKVASSKFRWEETVDKYDRLIREIS